MHVIFRENTKIARAQGFLWGGQNRVWGLFFFRADVPQDIPYVDTCGGRHPVRVGAAVAVP
jgi:hypothetical protein